MRKGLIGRGGMKQLAALAAIALTVGGCSSIDCPVQNIVSCVYQVSSNDSANAYLPDTLSVSTLRADGTDSILFNRGVGTSKLELPMSLTRAADTLLVERKGSSWRTLDTLYVEKQNHPRFESIDCQQAYFHTITGVSHTRWGIDSVSINKTSVNYDASTPHLLLYFKRLR